MKEENNEEVMSAAEKFTTLKSELLIIIACSNDLYKGVGKERHNHSLLS